MRISKNIVVVMLAAILPMLFLTGCEDTLKGVNKINFSEFKPSGEADTLTMKYTDSGRIKAILISPKMLDYGTVEYPFTEFPKGIEVTLYDKNNKRTFISSEYAVQFKGTTVIDLRKNVRIRSESGQLLQTEQLYYDQKNEWFFTEKFFKFTDPEGGSTTGQGIDFNRDFKRINFQRVKGVVNQSE